MRGAGAGGLAFAIRFKHEILISETGLDLDPREMGSNFSHFRQVYLILRDLIGKKISKRKDDF